MANRNLGAVLAAWAAFASATTANADGINLERRVFEYSEMISVGVSVSNAEAYQVYFIPTSAVDQSYSRARNGPLRSRTCGGWISE